MTSMTGSLPLTRTKAHARHPSLVPERDLFALARVDKKARDLVVGKHLGLVRIIASKYQGIPPEDLFQEGCVGLVIAIYRFDPDRSPKFSTYAAWWIRNTISRALQRDLGQIYLPAHVYFDNAKLERESTRMEAQNGHEPTEVEVSRVLGWDRERVTKTRNLPTSYNQERGMERLSIADDIADEYITKDEPFEAWPVHLEELAAVPGVEVFVAGVDARGQGRLAPGAPQLGQHRGVRRAEAEGVGHRLRQRVLLRGGDRVADVQPMGSGVLFASEPEGLGQEDVRRRDRLRDV